MIMISFFITQNENKNQYTYRGICKFLLYLQICYINVLSKQAVLYVDVEFIDYDLLR